jgi:hypothetical protein
MDRLVKSEALAVQVERRIFLVRGQKVMLDAHLAELYHVPTKSLNLAVKRNADRFPEDFTFQLTAEEADGLRFHFETSKLDLVPVDSLPFPDFFSQM